jgi:hypothetical protein
MVSFTICGGNPAGDGKLVCATGVYSAKKRQKINALNRSSIFREDSMISPS